MSSPSGNPGRAQGRRGKWQRDRVPAGRIAWTELFFGKLGVNKYSEYQEDATGEQVVDERVGQSVSLDLHSAFEHRNIKFVLTNLTGPELDAFEKIVSVAVSEARPTVELRDRLAREAFSSGDDSYERNYRGVPTVVVRPGQER